jgi:hypothetical protein
VSPEVRRILVGVGGAAAIVVALAWFQLAVFNPLAAGGGASPAPDPALLAWRVHLARLVEMTGLVGVVLLGVAWRSLATGAAYTVFGAFLAFRWPVWIAFRRQGNSDLLSDVLTWPSDAQFFLEDAGRALIVSGIVILVLVWRERLAGQASPTP